MNTYYFYNQKKGHERHENASFAFMPLKRMFPAAGASPQPRTPGRATLELCPPAPQRDGRGCRSASSSPHPVWGRSGVPFWGPSLRQVSLLFPPWKHNLVDPWGPTQVAAPPSHQWCPHGHPPERSDGPPQDWTSRCWGWARAGEQNMCRAHHCSPGLGPAS